MTAARPGLTLLEVVAATAMLAVIAAACLPMLGESRRWVEATSLEGHFDELAAYADLILADPERHGLTAEDLTSIGFEAEIAIDLPEGDLPELGTITVRLLVADADDVRHGWLVFRAGDDSVLRYVELPEEAAP